MTSKSTTTVGKIKLVIQFTGGAVLICGVGWYLATQFASIDSQLDHVVSADIPTIKNRLAEDSNAVEEMQVDMGVLTQNITAWEDQQERIRKMQTSIDFLCQKFNDELLPGGMGSEHTTDAIKVLVQHIDTLSKQYMRFFELAENKIVVSLPPRWVDELPHRSGTLYALGISPSDTTLAAAQKYAVQQALSMMSVKLRRKTFDEIRSAVTSAGKPSPRGFEELSPAFKQQVNKAVDELLGKTYSESYWVDSNGYVYALVSLPIEKYIEQSKLGTLLETLRQAQQSIMAVFADSGASLESIEGRQESRKEMDAADPDPVLVTGKKVKGGKESGTQLPREYARDGEKKRIQEFISAWKHEWENKDHQNYMQRYSKAFASRGMNWKQWSRYKKDLSERYRNISLSLEDIYIVLEDTHAVVSFKQSYRSDEYTDYGIKSLILKKEDGEWKIFSEHWEHLPNG